MGNTMRKQCRKEYDAEEAIAKTESSVQEIPTGKCGVSII
jgi:hypothetical protein